MVYYFVDIEGIQRVMGCRIIGLWEVSVYVPVTEGEFLRPKDGFMDRHLNDG